MKALELITEIKGKFKPIGCAEYKYKDIKVIVRNEKTKILDKDNRPLSIGSFQKRVNLFDDIVRKFIPLQYSHNAAAQRTKICKMFIKDEYVSGLFTTYESQQYFWDYEKDVGNRKRKVKRRIFV